MLIGCQGLAFISTVALLEIDLEEEDGAATEGVESRRRASGIYT